MWGSCFWTWSLHLIPSSSRNWCTWWLNWETPLQCITGLWFSLLGDHSVSGWPTKHPPPSSWTPARSRGMCPLLDTLMTYDCRARHGNSKTMEMVLDFGSAAPIMPSLLYINSAAVEIIHSFKNLGEHLSHTISWCTNSAAAFKKAHEYLYLVRNLRSSYLNRTFYSCAVETSWSPDLLWFGGCTVAEKMELQQVIKSAQRTIGCSLPSTGDIRCYSTRCKDGATCILHESTHLVHQLFTNLLSGQRLQSIWSETSRKRSSFHPDAIRQLHYYQCIWLWNCTPH